MVEAVEVMMKVVEVVLGSCARKLCLEVVPKATEELKVVKVVGGYVEGARRLCRRCWRS